MKPPKKKEPMDGLFVVRIEKSRLEKLKKLKKQGFDIPEYIRSCIDKVIN